MTWGNFDFFCFFGLFDEYLAERVVDVSSFYHIMEEEFCKVVVVCDEGILVVVLL